jgi:hypothetical protein
MTEERLVLAELLEKAGDGDFLRAVAEAVLQLLMETDVEGLIGAGRYERSGERTTWRGADASHPQCPARRRQARDRIARRPSGDSSGDLGANDADIAISVAQTKEALFGPVASHAVGDGARPAGLLDPCGGGDFSIPHGRARRSRYCGSRRFRGAIHRAPSAAAGLAGGGHTTHTFIGYPSGRRDKRLRSVAGYQDRPCRGPGGVGDVTLSDTVAVNGGLVEFDPETG